MTPPKRLAIHVDALALLGITIAIFGTLEIHVRDQNLDETANNSMPKIVAATVNATKKNKAVAFLTRPPQGSDSVADISDPNASRRPT